MKAPFVSKDVWAELYDAAIKFRALAPWQWIDDYEIFGVENPFGNTTGYCAVLGTLGEVCGLCIYRGSNGLALHIKIATEEVEFDDLLGTQDHLMLEFVSKGELDSEDKKILTELGLQFRGKKQYPQFRSYLPGYAPWFLIKAEAQFLTFAIQCGIDAAVHRKQDPLFLRPRNDEEYLVYVPEKSKGNRFFFSKTWKKPAPMVTSETRMPPTEIKELRNQLQTDSIWEADVFYMSAKICDRERPYLLRNVMIAQQSTGLILAMNAIVPEENGNLAVEKQILSTIEQSGLIPQEVQVKDASLARSMSAFAEALGFQIAIRNRLPAISEAREYLKRSLGSGSFPF